MFGPNSILAKREKSWMGNYHQGIRRPKRDNSPSTGLNLVYSFRTAYSTYLVTKKRGPNGLFGKNDMTSGSLFMNAIDEIFEIELEKK